MRLTNSTPRFIYINFDTQIPLLTHHVGDGDPPLEVVIIIINISYIIHCFDSLLLQSGWLYSGIAIDQLLILSLDVVQLRIQHLYLTLSTYLDHNNLSLLQLLRHDGLTILEPCDFKFLFLPLTLLLQVTLLKFLIFVIRLRRHRLQNLKFLSSSIMIQTLLFVPLLVLLS